MSEQQASELLDLLRQIAADIAAIKAASEQAAATGMPVFTLA